MPRFELELGRKRMRSLAIALAVCVATTGAYAQPPATTPRTPSCHDEATTKKLAGGCADKLHEKVSAPTSATACDTAASDKKLAGAAKTSFTKKCVTDLVGERPRWSLDRPTPYKYAEEFARMS